jgi:hypothetical protein
VLIAGTCSLGYEHPVSPETVASAHDGKPRVDFVMKHSQSSNPSIKFQRCDVDESLDDGDEDGWIEHHDHQITKLV